MGEPAAEARARAAGAGPTPASACRAPASVGPESVSACPAPAAPPAPSERLDPAARPYLDALAAAFPDIGGSVTEAGEARRILAAAPRPAVARPRVGAVEDRSVPGPPGAPPVPVRVYLPDPEQWPGPRPTVVFAHGGGWVLGDLDTYDTTARGISRAAGAAVVSVDYRRAPEHRFPAALEDVHAALCWAGAHLDELGGAPEALVVAGDSSGGNLAAAAALLARERGPAVALQVLVYPALDAAQDSSSYRADAEGCFLTAAHMRWFWAQYLGPDGRPDHPLASPLRADPAGLPPAHVVVAGCDPLRDDGAAYHRRLGESGITSVLDVRPGLFHGFLALAGVLPEARAALEGMGGAIRSTLSDGKTSGEAGGDAG
ncbi:alpha/beta hydrolase [Streptomyces sp. NPDC058746]|uniref:alpha/beta hydrolase n=1 Tax=Streptomyces sp. NPDC058746 TaxID=3346622 RepID=UPI0036BFA786